MPSMNHTQRTAAVTAVVALAAMGLTSVTATSGAAQAAEEGHGALLTSAPARGLTPPPAVRGESQLFTLDPGLLSGRTAGQHLTLPAGADGSATTVLLTSVRAKRSHATWTGTVVGDELGSFTLVRSGSTYAGSLISPDGIHTLTLADGDRYWWTDVPPQTSGSGDDAVPSSALGGADAGELAEAAAPRRAKRAKRPKIKVMFGFTKAAKAAVGGKAQVKANARLVIAQTNQTFANSGIKAKVKLSGVVKAKGKETANAVKDVKRLAKRGDGRFDNLHRQRRRHHADIMHLFTSGDATKVCGAGMMPERVQWARPALGASMSFIQCMPYLVATHELGHNLGGDHIHYPGVSHDSKIPGAYAFFNVPGGYFTVMGYYDPCVDAGIYTCVRLPYFSTPKRTYNGQPLAVGKASFNARVVSKVAPRVARYLN